MSLRDTLTNEKLNDRFENPFSLVNHAIIMAEQGVEHGEGMKSHLASDILEVIADHEEDECPVELEKKVVKEREEQLV